MEEWQEQEEKVRAMYPDAEWVSQEEFDKRFNEAPPVHRGFHAMPHGIMAMRQPNGKLMVVTRG